MIFQSCSDIQDAPARVRHAQMILNSNTVTVRPVEHARAHWPDKVVKKALTEDAGADALRGTPCSAHISG